MRNSLASLQVFLFGMKDKSFALFGGVACGTSFFVFISTYCVVFYVRARRSAERFVFLR